MFWVSVPADASHFLPMSIALATHFAVRGGRLFIRVRCLLSRVLCPFGTTSSRARSGVSSTHQVSGIVVKKTRFTSEQEAAVRKILDFFGGEEVLPHCLLAVTCSTESREKLLDDISKLPINHSLRRMNALVNDRVLPVENIKEGAKLVSRLMLHKGVSEVLEFNGGPFTWEERQTAHMHAAASAASQPLPGLELISCKSSWDVDRRRLTTVCDFR
eukprot:TRINITY_DN26083_c0_g1_i4.p1 TRINITY_DN26083_c0_g1~~TRINITY_DN26083_c0_g1_i4.p1  ORF type:complete len:216 (+),score=25.73 TRINITY_DN26083_c0_g1_i4:78-725(+)